MKPLNIYGPLRQQQCYTESKEKGTWLWNTNQSSGKEKAIVNPSTANNTHSCQQQRNNRQPRLTDHPSRPTPDHPRHKPWLISQDRSPSWYCKELRSDGAGCSVWCEPMWPYKKKRAVYWSASHTSHGERIIYNGLTSVGLQNSDTRAPM